MFDYEFAYVNGDEVWVRDNTPGANGVTHFMPTGAFEIFQKQMYAVGYTFRDVTRG